MTMPSHAVLLAAGLGTRMRPLTDDTAKTLLRLGKRTLMDRALDQLADAGVERVLVGAHWQAGKIRAHLAERHAAPRTIVLEEDTLLDTGGTVAKALADGYLPGHAPFLVANGDSAWLDGPVPVLRRLAGGFDMRLWDGMLLLARATEVGAEVRQGDFMLDPMGVPRRPQEGEVAPFVYAGLQVLSPRLFEDTQPVPVGMNVFWDRALATGRLGAIVHDGVFFHLTTPRDLDEAEHVMEGRLGGIVA